MISVTIQLVELHTQETKSPTDLLLAQSGRSRASTIGIIAIPTGSLRQMKKASSDKEQPPGGINNSRIQVS